jgi:hypothetical protein
MEVRMKCCIVALSAALIASAQVPSVAIAPGGQTLTAAKATNPTTRREKRIAAAGVPVLGYVLGPGPVELFPIVLATKTPQIGEAVSIPDNAKCLYLPPRQQYALIEQNSDNPVAVWSIHRAVTTGTKQDEVAIQGAIAHPDIVSFSPRGDALVLYSQAASILQLVSNLPVQRSVSRQLSLPNSQTPSLISISDDAALVLVEFADGGLMSSLNGSPWRSLPIAFTPLAWSFIPRTHDLAISDPTRKMIALISNVDEASKASRILAQDMQADHLAVTKDGEQLVAANMSTGQTWTINLKGGTVTQNEETTGVSTLISLRDGFTFLLSSSPKLSLLKVSDSPE